MRAETLGFIRALWRTQRNLTSVLHTGDVGIHTSSYIGRNLKYVAATVGLPEDENWAKYFAWEATSPRAEQSTHVLKLIDDRGRALQDLLEEGYATLDLMV